jgi:hypothetical protein
MDSALLAILMEADHPADTEWPPGFDWRAEESRVRALAPLVGEVAGLAVEVDATAQDASFFADLLLHDGVKPNKQSGRVLTPTLTIRFSSFGNLFTTWSAGGEQRTLPAEIVHRIIHLIAGRGYQYVPSAELNEPYSGKNPHLRGATWWLRFFDYL